MFCVKLLETIDERNRQYVVSRFSIRINYRLMLYEKQTINHGGRNSSNSEIEQGNQGLCATWRLDANFGPESTIIRPVL